jgi:hypothetical protein
MAQVVEQLHSKFEDLSLNASTVTHTHTHTHKLRLSPKHTFPLFCLEISSSKVHTLATVPLYPSSLIPMFFLIFEFLY